MRAQRHRTYLSACRLAAWAAAWLPAAAWSHGEHEAQADWMSAWNFSPDVVIGIGLFAWWYAAGLWRQRGRGHPLSLGKHVGYFGGLALLFISLASPIDALADRLFFMHQVQHLLLQTLGPMLLILAAPQGLLIRGMPARLRHALLGPSPVGRGLRALFGYLSRPWISALLLVASLYVWQWPPYHDRSVLDVQVHYVMHITMLAAGLLFFSSMLSPHPPPLGARYGTRINVVCFAMTANMLLGAWMALKEAVWYTAYDRPGRLWGIDPLVDESLGGLIVWIPGSFACLPAVIVLLRLWNSREARLDVRRRRGFASGLPAAAVPNHRIAYWLGFAALAAFAGTLTVGVLSVQRA